MAPAPDNLAVLKDDMIAFIEGHGMRRFHGYVDYEEVHSVIWKNETNPATWKGCAQLGFAQQGIMMVYEASTEWYDHYQRLLELSEDFGGIPIDGSGPDEEI